MAARTASAAECSLNLSEAAELAGNQIEELEASRDLPAATEEVRRNLAPDIRDYLTHQQSPGDLRARGLLFFIADREQVCALYWESTAASEPMFVSAELSLNSRALRTLVLESVAGLIGAPVRPERAPRPRQEPAPASRSAVPMRPTVKEQGGSALRALSDSLFPVEIASRLERLASLSIVPALNFGTVPFAALDPDQDGRPMVESTSINVEESFLAGTAQVFGWDGERIAENPAVVGDPDATDDPDWVLPRLPAAGREAAEVARLLRAEPLLGEAATVAAVAALLPHADYIHVAAHGLASAEDPIDGSFLALTKGRLTARQIQQMSLLSTPLVVLSACQTGLGGTLEAGVTGLARAFIIAGAFNVIASLWNVDDEATAFIMLRFIEHLRDEAPSTALRLAQLDGRKRWAEPTIWAPFIVFGRRTVVP